MQDITAPATHLSTDEHSLLGISVQDQVVMRLDERDSAYFGAGGIGDEERERDAERQR